MPRAIAFSELGASGCMSFASASILSETDVFCALLCLRALGFQHLLIISGAGVAAATTPGSCGPGMPRSLPSLLQRFRHFLGTRHASDGGLLLYFCYYELYLDTVRVILGSMRI